MTTYFSFLATLQGYWQGAIAPQPTDRYVFSAHRDQFLPATGIPGYVGHMNDLQLHLSRISNATLLSPNQLQPANTQQMEPASRLAGER